MSLKEYNKKRDFSQTNEPEGKVDLSHAQRFVIQRHQASRLHYDLRLEIDGVLKSWAVPKGPSMNPNDKRLAVQTEDHPIKYLTFEGTIPKGNYGAGHMVVWDSGTFIIYVQENEGNIIEQYDNGNLKVRFFGSKLKGKFALFKTRIEGKQQHWLLIKKEDEFSTDLPYDAENLLPQYPDRTISPTIKKLKPKKYIAPMLAEKTGEIFNHKDWIYEFKWDGYRMIAHINEGEVFMYSRNGLSFNKKFNLLYQDLMNVPHDVVLDGEVVLVDHKGLAQFQKLQKYDPETTEGRLVYYVFDILHLNGHDTISLPLLDRKSLIPEVIDGLNNIEYCDHVESIGLAFYERAIKLGMEGVMAKKADSLYSPGYRTKDWLKFKEITTTEAIICGYTAGTGRGKLFGSLILGEYRDNKLKYIGNCGSGFNHKEQKELLELFNPLKIKRSPFITMPNLKGRVPYWLRPELVCEVKFSEWTKSGVMRHPIYKGLLNNPTEVNYHIEKNNSASQREVANKEGTLKLDGVEVPISNLDKFYWPESGYRKYDLIDYYIKISDYILPYLKDRPQNLHRHPNGINSDGFYQKDNESLPGFVKSVELYSKSAERDINYMLCQDEASLIYMANLGCIEINPWSSRIETLDMPDYTVIDLDPSNTNSFEQVIKCARVAKDIFDELKIQAYCKTTGKSGIHIYLPLGAKYNYSEARTFTKLLCVLINERLPKLTSLERTVKKRKGKIYLDFMQNRRAQTLASVYCVRPVDGATVSTPISWEEIEKGLNKNDFNIKTVPDRLDKIGDIFKNVLGDGIDIEKILENI